MSSSVILLNEVIFILDSSYILQLGVSTSEQHKGEGVEKGYIGGDSCPIIKQERSHTWVNCVVFPEPVSPTITMILLSRTTLISYK